MNRRAPLAALLTAVLTLAACGGGGGGGSGSDDGGSDVAPPAAPADLAAEAGVNRVTLSWSDVPEATSYRLSWSKAADGPFEEIDDVASPFVHSGLDLGDAYFYFLRARNAGGKSVPSETVTATPEGTFPGDPLFENQWHLREAASGLDVGAEGAWAEEARGQGIRIAIVDDGLEIGHEDLAPNVVPGGSHDYVGDDSKPTSGDYSHGTSTAGLAAARGGNGLGVTGVAPRAELVGFNYIQDTTTTNEVDAMTRDLDEVGVSSNSWGPPDNRRLGWATSTWRAAVRTGTEEGRGGLGIVYVFAAGNGGEDGENSNHSGYANAAEVMAVTATDRSGRRVPWGEDGANIWLAVPVAPGLVTTDRTGSAGVSSGNYRSGFSGTSAATPVAAGIAALVLSANPDLRWDEVRRILAETAVRNAASDSGWTTNGAGHLVHHAFGFGVPDAAAAVARARTWVSTGSLRSHETDRSRPGTALPDGSAVGVSDTIAVATSITNVFYVEVTLDTSDHPFLGDLEVVLRSPAGTESVLAETNAGLRRESGYDDWTFGTARCLGENPNGPWRLTIRDRLSGDTGTFRSWKLEIRGQR